MLQTYLVRACSMICLDGKPQSVTYHHKMIVDFAKFIMLSQADNTHRLVFITTPSPGSGVHNQHIWRLITRRSFHVVCRWIETRHPPSYVRKIWVQSQGGGGVCAPTPRGSICCHFKVHIRPGAKIPVFFILSLSPVKHARQR